MGKRLRNHIVHTSNGSTSATRPYIYLCARAHTSRKLLALQKDQPCNLPLVPVATSSHPTDTAHNAVDLGVTLWLWPLASGTITQPAALVNYPTT
ncbi:hypothetical protein C0Q70_11954 [Pomacea canaliculata]|uniref:Uncharacterized protein n=1 Tax=Pomacea canaliculata TaxID=400727 RepID=A0A2T7P7I8_POMCA|nr:hypothetical protein C0Q70_11954 [Pomacea canaliculata]